MADDSKKGKFQDIFDQIGIGDLPAEEKEKFFREMNEVVEMAVIAKVARVLSDEEKEEFAKLEADEDQQKFLAEKKIDVTAIAMEEAVKFRERFLADVSYITGRVEQKKRDELENEKKDQ